MDAIRSDKQYAGVKCNKDEIKQNNNNHNYARVKAIQLFKSKIFSVADEKVRRLEAFTNEERTLLRHQTQRKVRPKTKSIIDEVLNNDNVRNKEVLKGSESVKNNTKDIKGVN
jgi:hypothetical protein